MLGFCFVLYAKGLESLPTMMEKKKKTTPTKKYSLPFFGGYLWFGDLLRYILASFLRTESLPHSVFDLFI